MAKLSVESCEAAHTEKKNLPRGLFSGAGHEAIRPGPGWGWARYTDNIFGNVKSVTQLG
jgi:hypothetical protein